VAQLIDLWMHIHRQPGGGGGEQHAEEHREASDQTPAQGVTSRQSAQSMCTDRRCPRSRRSQRSSCLHTVIGSLEVAGLTTGAVHTGLASVAGISDMAPGVSIAYALRIKDEPRRHDVRLSQPITGDAAPPICRHLR
jgi:hypothetical protein